MFLYTGSEVQWSGYNIYSWKYVVYRFIFKVFYTISMKDGSTINERRKRKVWTITVRLQNNKTFPSTYYVVMLTGFLFHRRSEKSPVLIFPHHFTVANETKWKVLWICEVTSGVEWVIVKPVWISKRLERLCFFHSAVKQTQNTRPRCHNTGF